MHCLSCALVPPEMTGSRKTFFYPYKYSRLVLCLELDLTDITIYSVTNAHVTIIFCQLYSSSLEELLLVMDNAVTGERKVANTVIPQTEFWGPGPQRTISFKVVIVTLGICLPKYQWKLSG
jgi:hypothetical protein